MKVAPTGDRTHQARASAEVLVKELTEKLRAEEERTLVEQSLGREARAQLSLVTERLRAIESSAAWKITQPIRRAGQRLSPRFRANLIRVCRVLWWTATLQLWQRLKERRIRNANSSIEPQVARLPHRDEAELPPALQYVTGPVALIIDDRWPEPDRDSGSLDALNMIKSLVAFGYHVIFATEMVLQQEARYVEGVRALGAHPLMCETSSELKHFIETYSDQFVLCVLTRIGAGGQYLELIQHNCPRARVVFNTVDLHFLREARAARLADDSDALAAANRTRDREEFLAGRSDLTIVVSELDQELLQRSVLGANVLYLPLARRVRKSPTPFSLRRGMGFVGGFAHQPNVDAIRYFLSEIWPLVQKSNPELTFEIVGAGLPDDVLEGVVGDVRYLGAIEDLDGWFDQLRMSVAPLRFGAGAKGKVASSLCAAVPCIATTVAAEGMGLTDGRNVLIAHSAEEFASKILALHDNEVLWSTLSDESHAFALEGFSLSAFSDKLRKALAELQLPTFAALKGRMTSA